MASHRRPPKPVIAVVVLALLGAAGWFWWQSQQQTATATGLVVSGSVQSADYHVASAIAGRITAVAADEGATVTAGETLVRLDSAALDLQLSQAKQGVKAAEAAVTNAKKDGTKADVTAAKARLAQAKAAVELARLQRGYSTVTAPHDGTVVTVVANIGQNASPGRTLITITDPSDLSVKVFVPEPNLGAVKVGQRVSVTADGIGKSFDGTVSFIATQSEFTPNTVETKDQRTKLVYQVRVSVADSSGVLKSGMPVDVAFS